MRSRTGFDNTDLLMFFPRVYDIDIQTLGFYFRWGFTANELAETSVGAMAKWDLNVETAFKLDRKTHRRMEFTNLANKGGWMQVKLLTIVSETDAHYLLTSCFDDIGTRIEFKTLNNLFDHTVEHAPLDFQVPKGVAERSILEMEKHQEFSIDHWKNKQLRSFRKTEDPSDEVEIIEKQLNEIKNEMKRYRDLQLDGDSSAVDQLASCRARQKELRASLMIAENDENKSKRKSVSENSYSHDVSLSTLFTMRWRVEASQ